MATTATRSNSNGSKNEVSAADVESQIQQLRDDISALTKTVTAYGSSQAEKLGGRAEKKRDELMKSSQDALDGMRHEVSSLEAEFETQVRRKPLQAVALAAAAGFLVAMVTRR